MDSSLPPPEFFMRKCFFIALLQEPLDNFSGNGVCHPHGKPPDVQR
jgi:hypothetical protein